MSPPIELSTGEVGTHQHRELSIPDLLIAATAELAELTVLHLDEDFELIAALTAQPLERLDVT